LTDLPARKPFPPNRGVDPETTPHWRGEEVVMASRTAGSPYGALGRIGVVAGMHVAVLFLIANSLGIHPLKLNETMEGTVIEEPVRPNDPPPPVTPVRLDPTVPVVPIPVIDPIPVEDAGPTITAVAVPVDQLSVSQPGSADPVPNIVGAQVDSRHPLTQPAYPSKDIRDGNEGSAVLEIYVLANGRVGDARILKSTGSESLDRAAVTEAKRNWRMKPATRDGVPFADWYKMSVVFRLENR
jgi:periplasmic protein TonB